MAFLIDVDGCCDEDLEQLIKARAEDGRGASIWDKLQNRWGRALVEMTFGRLKAPLQRIQQSLRQFFRGQPPRLEPLEAGWVRIGGLQLEQMRARLEGLDPRAMASADYQDLVEYLCQRYLPPEFALREGEFLAVRAVLLGKVQAALEHDRRLTDPMIDTLSALLPTEFVQIPPQALSPVEMAILKYGRAHAAENIRHVSEAVRHRMQTIVLEHMQGQLLGQKEGIWAHAQTRLFDEFSALNRDMRRIAITESGEMINQGYVAAVEPGRQVKRVEAYDACPFCKSIDGLVLTVVPPPNDPSKTSFTEVWTGKTNVGRSASHRTADGIERTPDEMWHVAAGVQHPHCRGAWVSVANRPAYISEEFHYFLQGKLDATMGRAD